MTAHEIGMDNDGGASNNGDDSWKVPAGKGYFFIYQSLGNQRGEDGHDE